MTGAGGGQVRPDARSYTGPRLIGEDGAGEDRRAGPCARHRVPRSTRSGDRPRDAGLGIQRVHRLVLARQGQRPLPSTSVQVICVLKCTARSPARRLSETASARTSTPAAVSASHDSGSEAVTTGSSRSASTPPSGPPNFESSSLTSVWKCRSWMFKEIASACARRSTRATVCKASESDPYTAISAVPRTAAARSPSTSDTPRRLNWASSSRRPAGARRCPCPGRRWPGTPSAGAGPSGTRTCRAGSRRRAEGSVGRAHEGPAIALRSQELAVGPELEGPRLQPPHGCERQLPHLQEDVRGIYVKARDPYLENLKEK